MNILPGTWNITFTWKGILSIEIPLIIFVFTYYCKNLKWGGVRKKCVPEFSTAIAKSNQFPDCVIYKAARREKYSGTHCYLSTINKANKIATNTDYNYLSLIQLLSYKAYISLKYRTFFIT